MKSKPKGRYEQFQEFRMRLNEKILGTGGKGGGGTLVAGRDGTASDIGDWRPGGTSSGGGGSGIKDDAAFANLSTMLALAKHPNIGVKLSGAPSLSSQPYPYRNIHQYIKQIFDAFGPQRMFWGTDITRMPCTWKQCVTMYTEEMPWLKGNDLELVMGRGLCEFIGWKV